MLRWLRSLEPRWILIASWLFTIVYAFPGYMNWDASSQETQARAGEYGDGHPPLMAFYWHLFEKVMHGPFLMLLLQVSLFIWALYQIFKLRFQPRTAAWITLLLFLFPPILTPMSVVWKDAQMAGFLFAGLMLALRDSRRARVVGIALLFFGVGVRHNAPFALPPLCLFIVATWGYRKKLAIIGIGAAIALGVTASALLINDKLATREYWWYRTFAIHDIVGTVCLSPPMTDQEIRASLEGVPLLQEQNLQQAMCKAYDPRAWFPATFGDNRMFGQAPDPVERGARGVAWKKIVFGHPKPYLEHRWRVFKEVIGLSAAPVWEPVCREFGANKEQMALLQEVHSQSAFQSAVSSLASALGGTIFYRAWLYLLGSFILLGYALYRRDRWLMALLGSGILYELSYFIGAPSADFRYSHWMITCCCIALVTIIGQRIASASTARPTSTPSHRTDTP